MMQAMSTGPRVGARTLAVAALLLALGTVVAYVGLLQALIPLRPVFYLSKDVPRPATVVIDRDGVVRWTAFGDNVQSRPDPHDVLRAVRALAG
jgi:hypothetical protein